MRNVAAEQPETARALQAAVTAWRAEVLGAAGKDDRPFPVGYREFPRTPLPARDGEAHGGIQRSAPAPNCSYFVHWTDTGDAMTWDIDVATTGDYDAEMLYACPPADTGSVVELEFRGERIAATISRGWVAPLIDGQDRVPRKGESLMKEFRAMPLGTLRMQKGRGLLTLRATSIKGAHVAEVRQLNLTLRPEAR